MRRDLTDEERERILRACANGVPRTIQSAAELRDVLLREAERRELLAARAVVEVARTIDLEARNALRWYEGGVRVATHPELRPSLAKRLARDLGGPLAAYDEAVGESDS